MFLFDQTMDYEVMKALPQQRQPLTVFIFGLLTQLVNGEVVKGACLCPWGGVEGEKPTTDRPKL